MDRSLQLSSSDSSRQLEVWSHLDGSFHPRVVRQSKISCTISVHDDSSEGEDGEDFAAAAAADASWWLWWWQWSPLLHVDALAVVAGELSFRAGRQLYPFHLHAVKMSKNLKGYENKNQNVKELKRIWIRDENVWWGQNGDLLTMRIWMVNNTYMVKKGS